jgi:hypothetical protein
MIAVSATVPYSAGLVNAGALDKGMNVTSSAIPEVFYSVYDSHREDVMSPEPD